MALATQSNNATSRDPAVGAPIECDLLVLGGGPGGYSAAFRAADLGLKTVIVERYGALGGVCLNVGCIPSKALLHVASLIDETTHMHDCGVSFAKPEIDLTKLRAHKEKIVDRMGAGLKAMAKARKVEVVRGRGVFIDPFRVAVDLTTGPGQETTGQRCEIRFARCIVAAGSTAQRLPFLPDDPRIVDSTGALELRTIPERLLVIGGGIIGLEMATVYSTLGSRIDVVEMLDGLMPGPDRDLVKIWEKENRRRFDRIMLKTRTVSAEARADGIYVSFAGETLVADAAAPTAPERYERYDMVLHATGRVPNGKTIGAEKAGIAVSGPGFIAVDAQMRSNVRHIFAIGDIVGQPMLAHKAVHQGHVAAEVAAGEAKGDAALARTAFDARVIPSVAYTHPEIAWVGLSETQAKADGRKLDVGKFPWAASGRANANGAEYGLTKLLFDGESGRLVGGAIVGPNAGDMIGEVALSIEMGCDAADIGKTIHPHPTLGESIGMAAEAAHGTCTDLPPAKMR